MGQWNLMFWFKNGSPVPLRTTLAGDVTRNKSIKEFECSVKCVGSNINCDNFYNLLISEIMPAY